MELSPDQENALEIVAQWFNGATPPVYETETRAGRTKNITVGTSHDYPVCAVGGFAGTGKTTILRYVAELHVLAVLVTPTHKAAQVLRAKLPGALASRVQTFHSLIYNPDPSFTCATSNQEMLLLEEPDDTVEHVLLSPCDFHVKVHNAVDDSLCDPKEKLRFIRREKLTGHHDLVIVDEASMLTRSNVCDIMYFGLPILLVGDPGQLPPVVSK